jgi:hypothetical protein
LTYHPKSSTTIKHIYNLELFTLLNPPIQKSSIPSKSSILFVYLPIFFRLTQYSLPFFYNSMHAHAHIVAKLIFTHINPQSSQHNFLIGLCICMNQDTTFTPRFNVNLRRIELTLISRLNQLELHLKRLTEAQEQLIYTTNYLQRTSAPFLVLSYISFTERNLDSQRTEITAATDAIREAIRLLRDLHLASR